MEIIDAHTHFYPPFASGDPESWGRDNGELYWAKLVGKRPDGKPTLQGFPDEKKLLSDMDSAGVSRAIIQGWYWEKPETCSLMNGEISKLVKAHPDRLSAFASVQPRFEKETLETIKRARDDGFSGAGEIHDGVQNFLFDSPPFEAFVRQAEENSLPICVHLTERGNRKYLGKTETDAEGALRAAKKFPKATFIFAHWCGGEIFEKSPLADEILKAENVYCDGAATPLMYPDSAWGRGAELMPSRALYGSDYPLRLFPKKFAKEEMDSVVCQAWNSVSQQNRAAFFSKNAMKILYRNP